jgi:hypothetical protein
METIYTPESILGMDKPTDAFLVKLEDNTYGIRFKGFKLRDCDTGEVYNEFSATNIYELDYFAEHELIYRFPHRLLKSKTIGSNLTLVVGENIVEKLDLIERHYIDDVLVANYHFKFPLFMPNSENNIEFIYSVPNLSDVSKKKLANGELIEAKSDTFIFVKGKLTIHRRANYYYEEY